MIELCPSSSGSGLMKFIATDLHWPSGTGRGCNEPGLFLVDDLLCIQLVQEGMYASSKALHMSGQ